MEMIPWEEGILFSFIYLLNTLFNLYSKGLRRWFARDRTRSVKPLKSLTVRANSAPMLGFANQEEEEYLVFWVAGRSSRRRAWTCLWSMGPCPRKLSKPPPVEESTAPKEWRPANAFLSSPVDSPLWCTHATPLPPPCTSTTATSRPMAAFGGSEVTYLLHSPLRLLLKGI